MTFYLAITNNKAVIKKLANRSFTQQQNAECNCGHCDCPDNLSLYGSPDHWYREPRERWNTTWQKMIGTGADALVQGLSEEQFQQLKENSMFEKVGCWVPIEDHDQHQPDICGN